MKYAGYGFLALALCGASFVRAQDETVLVNHGETVAFMGDSITSAGWRTPHGYVKLVRDGLAANDISIAVIPAGVSGHKSNQMLARLKKDVLDKKPDWMTLSCGVNDVWHGRRGVKLADYKKNITQIVDEATQADVKVMILTSTMIQEDPENAANKRLDGYNTFLKTLARKRNLPLADLNALMKDEVAKYPTPANGRKRTITRDGVHMRAAGNLMMARGVLRAFGLDDAQMKKAEAACATVPTHYRPACSVPLKTLVELEQLTSEAKKELDQAMRQLLKEQAEKGAKVIQE